MFCHSVNSVKVIRFVGPAQNRLAILRVFLIQSVDNRIDAPHPIEIPAAQGFINVPLEVLPSLLVQRLDHFLFTIKGREPENLIQQPLVHPFSIAPHLVHEMGHARQDQDLIMNVNRVTNDGGPSSGHADDIDKAIQRVSGQ
jgi:hypothetical protein